MAMPMMKGESDRHDDVKGLHLEGSHPFEQEVHLVGPDQNLGHKKASAPIHELGGKNPKSYSK